MWGRDFRRVIFSLEKSSMQMYEKRIKGLCYHCEEKLNHAHVYKSPKVYLLQVENNEGSEGDVVNEVENVSEEVYGEGQEEELEVSINTISSSPSSNTMRLLGVIGTQSVVILVDSSSTHNFWIIRLLSWLSLEFLKGCHCKGKWQMGRNC